ncbi:MAG: protein kinase, partial [Acidobacteriota bacterium]
MIGRKLADRYELTSELGKGGMGVVYLARDPMLDREVAIKTLHPGFISGESAERLRREARVVAKMDHPAITPVFDLGEHEGALFLVMPVLSGKTLRSLLDARELSLGDALRVLVQVAEALDYSHDRGVIHRDVKPENVMVTAERQELRARVMDFGLARDPSTRVSLTHSGGVLGTLAYMSPEQIQALPIDPCSDLYSLGAVLYESLTGRPPFSGPVHRLIVDIAQQEAPAVGELVQVDAELELLVSRCLAKDPRRRPQSGAEIAAVLRDCLVRLGGDALSQALAAQIPAPARPPSPSILGRSPEIAELEASLQAATLGECRLVLIDGEVGIGKTRLLEEAGRLAEQRGLRVVRGRVADRQDAPPYQAFCELIQDYFRGHDSEIRTSSVVADFSDLAGELVARFPIFGEIEALRDQAGGSRPDAPPAAAWGDGATPGEESGGLKVYELIARTLLRLAGGRPLAVLLENLHHGDASIAALSYALRRLSASPTLVVCTYRTAEVDRGHPLIRLLGDFGDDSRTTRVTLGPLDRQTLARLLERQLPPGAISEPLVDRVERVTEGNPLFAIELVKSLRSSDEIRRDRSGVWVIDEGAGLGSDPLPRTIQQAIERHLERLPESHQQYLQLASILGRSFDLGDLEALGDGDAFDSVDRLTDELVAEGLLAEDRRSRGDRLFFTSGLVREVLERQIPRRRRRRLHRTLARMLESRLKGGEADPRLVHHCAEGDLAAETVRYGLALARRAEAAIGHAEAIRAA